MCEDCLRLLTLYSFRKSTKTVKPHLTHQFDCVFMAIVSSLRRIRISLCRRTKMFLPNRFHHFELKNRDLDAL